MTLWINAGERQGGPALDKKMAGALLQDGYAAAENGCFRLQNGKAVFVPGMTPEKQAADRSGEPQGRAADAAKMTAADKPRGPRKAGAPAKRDFAGYDAPAFEPGDIPPPDIPPYERQF